MSPPARCFAAAALAVVAGGCSELVDLIDPTPPPVPPPDLTWVPPNEDLPPPMLNECSDLNETCTIVQIGPPFRLHSDPEPDPLERDEGVRRDLDGFLGMADTRPGGAELWIANDADPLLGGTVSRLDSRTVRELARYPSVTCFSNGGSGGTRACDGQGGCCSLDDWDRYQARQATLKEPPHQAVQRWQNNPSRVAVDARGDAYVANRAFGGQSSVTRIAGNLGACVDRNHNDRIDTSSDVNSNGVIDVDCNGDGIPDDADGVAKRPCQGGMPQEYFGVDDECVVWTTNTFRAKAIGRPLALLKRDFTNPLDEDVFVWAGSYATGAFARIDSNGRIENDVQLPDECWKLGTGPYGLVIDAQGIGWSIPMGQGKLCWFDARTPGPGPGKSGSVRDPRWGPADGYGVTLDRDLNIWLGGGVARYAPDRSSGTANLGSGWWTRIDGINGNGIAADARGAGNWFVWSCDGKGSVLQIPGSAIPPVHADQIIVPNAWPQVRMPCYGVALDAQQNVWGIDKSQATRALVDRGGAITQPVVNGPTQGNSRCPAGDSCPDPGAYTYSDLAAFGFRNYTAPRGYYSYVIASRCLEQNPAWVTRWIKVEWELDSPDDTSFSVRARGGKTPLPDTDWTDYTPQSTSIGLNLAQLQKEPDYIEVQFGFGTRDLKRSPKLKSARVYYECIFEK